VLGALLLLAGSVAGWADRTLFDAEAFAARARATLDDPSVRTVVARTFVRSVVEQAEPSLLAARPLVEAAAETVVATPAFGSVFETAARTGAQVLLERPADNFVVRANEAVLLLVDTIRVYAPDVAEQIPRSIDAALLSLRDISTERELWRDAGRVQELAWIFLLLGVLAWTAALVLARDRRRAIAWLGGAAVAAAAVLLLGLEVGGRLVASNGGDELAADALRAVWDTFTDGLRAVAWFGLGIGMIATAAVLAARPDPSRLTLRRVLDRASSVRTFEPSRPVAVVLAILLGAVGLAMVLAPLAVVELVVAATGALLVFLALVTLLELLARSGPADEPRPERRRPVIVVAVLAAVTLAVGTAVVVVATSPDAQSAAEEIVTCNGHEALCDRRLDEISFATSHNASSAADDGYLMANHVDGIPAQLRRGYHGFQLDAFLGTRRGNRVYTDLTDVQIESFTTEIGSDLVDRALQLREIVGPPTDPDRQTLYLCHAACELGATEASDAFDAMAAYLRTHPHDVLVWIVEDYAPVDRLKRGLAEAGLLDQRYVLDPDRLPTLRQMIAADRRLVVMLENQDGGPAMPNGYEDGVLQETPFSFPDAAALADPASCDDLRGVDTAPLFLLNHWVTPASVTATAEVNSLEFLDERARRCQAERRLLPNFVAVDFTSLGDTIEVVDALNDDEG
jgi:hypothetical protein